MTKCHKIPAITPDLRFIKIDASEAESRANGLTNRVCELGSVLEIHVPYCLIYDNLESNHNKLRHYVAKLVMTIELNC